LIKSFKRLSDACNLTYLFVFLLSPLPQGIPLGLAAAIPFLLQSDVHTANYRYQAIFSWVFWPFSLKLAWAPIVDSLYFRRLGRRKSWLIPIQYAIGIDLFVLSGKVNAWLGLAGDVQIWSLTCAFFGLTLLAATQDIVVDGWALTMLSKENVAWASTCNSVGQSLGYIVAFIVFLALESPDLCNKYLRFTPIPDQGLISFSGVFCFHPMTFISLTFRILTGLHHQRQRQLRVLDSPYFSQGDKKEEVEEDEGRHLSLIQTYQVMLGVLRLRPILKYIVFVFFVKFVFSASDNVFGLKLLENGLSKERLALMGTIVLPLQAILPLVVTPWSN
uniref:Acetyl-coenzyme A transporter 1 n=1 Tax=Schistocephalus solidus TaxID=70667 RepID=A0A183TJV5_SCHSO